MSASVIVSGIWRGTKEFREAAKEPFFRGNGDISKKKVIMNDSANREEKRK